MADPTKKRATRRERLDAAFRVRAGAQGLLACCRCEYPLKLYATASRHDEACPAHPMTISAMSVEGNDHYSLTFTKSGVLPATRTK